MARSKENTESLIDRYLAGKASPEERRRLERAYQRAALKKSDNGGETPEEIAGIGRESWLALMTRIQTRSKVARLWPRIAAAASILIGISIGGYFLLKNHPTQQTAQNQDLSPGTHRAILRTGYGKTYLLASLQNGRLSQQGNGSGINKLSAEQLAYNNTAANTAAPVYDTLTNPRGGTNYHLALSDGTRILLNAATTIRYPEKFMGNEREVELISGEAYVEVTHNPKMPFRLLTHQLTINDIGTHFDISAYDDDKGMQATLTEGSIRVSRGGQSVLLRPGEQAVMAYQHGDISVQPANTEATLAWTNNLFHFDHADLQTVMRQLSRWYNVEVVYEGAIPHQTVNGEIYRDLKASQLFGDLNYAQVKFRVEKNKIIVSDK